MSASAQIQGAATPVLLHHDLNKRNIFVSEDDPAIVTSIIDWQSTSIEPAFWYADEAPDFATPVGPDKNDLLRQSLCTLLSIPHPEAFWSSFHG